MKLSVQISAGANSPTGGWSRRTGARNGSGPEFELIDTGIFDEDRYFDIVHRIRQGRRRGHLHPHRGVQPRAGRGRRCTCCRTLWFRNIWGWGRHAPPRAAGSAPARAGRIISLLIADDSRSRWRWPICRSPIGSGRGTLYARAGGDAAVHRQRDELRTLSRRRARQTASRSSRTPFTGTSSTARTASTRPPSAPRPPSITVSTRSRRAVPSCCGCG